MNIVKILLVSFFCSLMGSWLYSEYFSKSSRVFTRMSKVKTGMSRSQVMVILPEPDTVYAWESGNDSVQVMHYDMGFDAPDAVRVFLKHDTVTAVTYDQ